MIAARNPLRRVALRSRPMEPGRWLMVRSTVANLAIAGMHIPNQFTGRKPAFHKSVADLAGRWRSAPIIAAGDTNSGRIDIDEQRPVFNRATHNWFDQLDRAGWVDTFRHRHGATREYTWYSPGHDNGFRLDQAFASQALVPAIDNVRHLWPPDPEQPGRRDAISDHAALIVDFDRSMIEAVTRSHAGA